MTAPPAGQGGPVLHDYWRSSAAYRVRIALALKGIAYRSEPVDLTAGAQHGAALRALNPLGRVPVLQVDGLVLTQSLAIIAYLDETRPSPPLMPQGAAERAQARAVALAVACDIHPVSNLCVLQRVEALAGPEARAAWNRDNIAAGLAAVEAMLDHPSFAGRFCVGEAPTIADCAVIPQLYNADRWGVSLAAMPRLRAVRAACDALEAFRSAAPRAEASAG